MALSRSKFASVMPVGTDGNGTEQVGTGEGGNAGKQARLGGLWETLTRH